MTIRGAKVDTLNNACRIHYMSFKSNSLDYCHQALSSPCIIPSEDSRDVDVKKGLGCTSPAKCDHR